MQSENVKITGLAKKVQDKLKTKPKTEPQKARQSSPNEDTKPQSTGLSSDNKKIETNPFDDLKATDKKPELQRGTSDSITRLQSLERDFGISADSTEVIANEVKDTAVSLKIPETIENPSDLCQYFGFQSVSDFKEAVETTGIIDFNMLENGEYTKTELAQVAKDLQTALDNVEEYDDSDEYVLSSNDGSEDMQYPLNVDFEADRIQKQKALTSLNLSAGLIKDNLKDGSQLALEIKGAGSEKEVKDILSRYCGNDDESAEILYDYLVKNASQSENRQPSGTPNDVIEVKGNPFEGRNVSGLMSLLYTNIGDKYVLNENLLNEFNQYEYDGTYDKQGNPNKYIVGGFYTNFEGDIGYLSYDYVDSNKSETGQEFVRLNFEEGNSKRELKYYMQESPNGEKVYCIINEPNEDIEETSSDFKKRLIIMQNYTTEIPETVISTEEISERYALLAQYDDNVAKSLNTLMSEFQTQGLGDDVRNWFVSLIGSSKIDDKEIVEEAGAAVGYTQIFMDLENGNLDEARSLADAEFERRLSACNTYMDLHKELSAYYGSNEIADEIMNSPAVLNRAYHGCKLDTIYKSDGSLEQINIVYPDGTTDRIEGIITDIPKISDIKATGIVGSNREMSSDEIYSFLTYGGNYKDSVEDYAQKSQDFTSYNAAIACGAELQNCKTPEDAFKLLTGKDITDPKQSKLITDEDVELFNSCFGTYNGDFPMPYTLTGDNGYGRSFRYTLEINVNDNRDGFDIVYKEFDEQGPFGEYDTPVNGTPANKIPDYTLEWNEGVNLFQMLTKTDSFDNSNQIVDKVQRAKFADFYVKNKSDVDSYVDEYAEFLMTNDPGAIEAKKRIAQKMGLKPADLNDAETIANYIKNTTDEEGNHTVLYDESCNYMQYAYLNSKQALYGDSRFENMTNQYCMEMGTYASNISHALSMGCMAASVVFPAAAPVLMGLAKAAGYLDNGIDLLNMLTNEQNYLDDDYAGWGNSLAFEIATKAGYRCFSNVAGNLSQASLEKTIDYNILGLENLLRDNPLAQVIYKGTTEGLIETGICAPYTMLLNAMQGGKYELGRELAENFIYDFLPYARGWQDVLIKGNDSNFKIYSNDGRYYSVDETGDKIYVNNDGSPAAVYGSDGKLKRTYTSEVDLEGNDTGRIRIESYDKTGDNLASVQIVSKFPDGTTLITDEKGNKIQDSKLTNEGYVVRYYGNDGSVIVSETTDKKGRLISSEQNGITTRYSLSGKPKSAKMQTSNGELEVQYKTVFGKTTAEINLNGQKMSYVLNKDGSIDHNGWKLTESSVIQAFAAGMGVDNLTDKLLNDMSGNIVQTDDVSCAIAAPLRAIGANYGLAQEFINKFGFMGVDENGNRIYQAPEEQFGKNTIITVGDNSNLFNEAYRLYLGDEGDTLHNGATMSSVFDLFMPGGSKIKVQPSSDNISAIKNMISNGSSAFGFSTSNDNLKAADSNGNSVDIEPNHGYTFEGFDKQNRIILSDPSNPDLKLYINEEDYLGKEGVQIIGATYDSGYDKKLYDANLEENQVRGLFGKLKGVFGKGDKDVSAPEYKPDYSSYPDYTRKMSDYLSGRFQYTDYRQGYNNYIDANRQAIYNFGVERLHQDYLQDSNSRYISFDDYLVKNKAKAWVYGEDEAYRQYVRNNFGQYGLDGAGNHDFAFDSHHVSNDLQGAWKMHIYAASDEERFAIMDTCGRYLNDNNISWKVLSLRYDVSYLGGIQAGKIFTIYPRNPKEFAQTACDLDYILKNNGLATSGTSIDGDAELGNSGRLFYRFEMKSKYLHDENGNDILGSNFGINLKSKEGHDLYYGDKDSGSRFYDGNYERQTYYNKYGVPKNGARHLAKDMTLDDDPWYKFNPSNPDNNPFIRRLKAHQQVQQVQQVRQNPQNVRYGYGSGLKSNIKYLDLKPVNRKVGTNPGDYLSKDAIPVNPGTVVGIPCADLANGSKRYVQISFSDPEVIKMFNGMPIGTVKTIGRQGDMRFSEDNTQMSRIHLCVQLDGYDNSGFPLFTIRDVSTNGTIFLR